MNNLKQIKQELSYLKSYCNGYAKEEIRQGKSIDIKDSSVSDIVEMVDKIIKMIEEV